MTPQHPGNKQHFGNNLGFTWRQPALPDNPPGVPRRALFRYRQSLVRHIHDAAWLEGNPFTLVEVKTLLDGVTVGGHRLADEQQILNLERSARHLCTLVETGRYRLTKQVSDKIHARTAYREALEWGHFRGEGAEVALTPQVAVSTNRSHQPPRTEPGGKQLVELYERGCAELARISHPCERGMVYFLFCALQQFYFDGNKRTGRFMMNGELMTHGWDAISIPAGRAREFNEKMAGFYTTKDGSSMLEFLYDCRPRDAIEAGHHATL